MYIVYILFFLALCIRACLSPWLLLSICLFVCLSFFSPRFCVCPLEVYSVSLFFCVYLLYFYLCLYLLHTCQITSFLRLRVSLAINRGGSQIASKKGLRHIISEDRMCDAANPTPQTPGTDALVPSRHCSQATKHGAKSQARELALISTFRAFALNQRGGRGKGNRSTPPSMLVLTFLPKEATEPKPATCRSDRRARPKNKQGGAAKEVLVVRPPPRLINLPRCVLLFRLIIFDGCRSSSWIMASSCSLREVRTLRLQRRLPGTADQARDLALPGWRGRERGGGPKVG